MIKVLRYLKRYWLALIVIVILLYTQAQTVLALPDYMSNIITYGISPTSGGVDSNVPKMLSNETFEHIHLFMEDKDFEKVKSNYEYIEFKDLDNSDLPYDIDLSDKSVVSGSGLYVLKDISSEKHDALSKLLTIPQLMVTAFNAAEAGETSLGGEDSQKQMQEMLAQFPEGTSIYEAFAMMPKEEVLKMVEGSEKEFSGSGESTLIIAGASAVKTEYENLGVSGSTLQNNYILSAGLRMLGFALLGGLCSIAVGFISAQIGARISRRMRKDVFESVGSFSSAELNNFSTASLITRTTNDVQRVQEGLIMTLRTVIYSPILAFGAVMHVFDSSEGMVWIIVAVVMLILVIIIITFAIIGPKFKKVQELTDRISLIVRENLSGMLVIRAFHNEKIEEERFDKGNKDIQNVNLFINRTFSIVMPIVMFIFNAVMLVILWFGSHEIDAGTMQIGDMMAFMQYAMQIIMAFIMLAMISIFLPMSSISAKRVFEVIDTEPTIHDPKQVIGFNTDAKGYIEFDDVSFRYPGAEEDVLSGISFTAKPGETTAFIGSTGSGKSTIVNLVPRFFDVTQGSIKVDGVDIRDVTQHDLHEKIGYVPQKGILFAGTIESNIKYSDSQMSDEQMMKAASIAQATEFIEGKDAKYQTEIAQGATNVSGGQKQRISIARAIAKDPEIYIFDDSFSALDYKTDAMLREALNKEIKHTHSTVLLVGQRIASIMNADQIIVLDEGKIAGIGKHKELLKTCEVYKEIAYSQLSKEELEDE